MRCFLLALALVTSGGVFAQDPPVESPKPPPAPAQEKKAERKPGEPKPYAEVVTKEAVSQDGLVKVHRIDDKILWEIPAAVYGRDLLWQTEIAGVPNTGGFLFPGTPAGARVVAFERRNNRVFLRLIDHSVRAYNDAGLELGVSMATVAPIVAAFDVEAEGEGKAAVIDVTRFFTSDPPEFAVRGALGGGNPDAQRTYVDRVNAYPENVETRTLYTFVGPAGARTALVHYSLVQLPEKPMMGRLADPRVGYFTQGYVAYGRPEQRATPRQYIARFRLEKKDPSRPMSDPVKPIVFYMPKETPAKWKRFIKLGVEDWRPAFEQAGFSNAIECRDQPDDPNWSPEDVRFSVIRWAPSPIQNAMGPSVQDPRSGETISAHIVMWHNILDLLQSWYFTQVGHLDPRAQRLPFPDELLGDLVRYVVAHEVGHTLGLRHNMKASSSYTIAQLRDPKFANVNGIAPSIMDYARFNYVAQPGDRVQILRSIVGPYDKFAIEWGYKPIPGAKSPDEERPFLDRLARRQLTDPTVRFAEFSPTDPRVQTEDVGDDPVEAARLGFINLGRVMGLLIPATIKPGDDYSLLREVYDEVIGHMSTLAFHVVREVGGVYDDNHVQAVGGRPFRLVESGRQRAAVQFLMDHVMSPPADLRNPAVIDRLFADGLDPSLLGAQGAVLNALFAEGRVARMLNQEASREILKGTPEAFAARRVYTVREMVDQVQGSIFREIKAPSVYVPIQRRALQREYLRRMQARLAAGASRSEFRAIGMSRVVALQGELRRAIGRTQHAPTAEHLRQCVRDVDDILKPKPGAVAGPATVGPFFPFVDRAPDCCWRRVILDPECGG
jgi:hypothetical protein